MADKNKLAPKEPKTISEVFEILGDIGKNLDPHPSGAVEAADAVELLPCPFCGNPAHFRSPQSGAWWIECQVCEVGTKYHSSQKLAASTWNTRASTPSPASAGWQELVAQLVEALKVYAPTCESGDCEGAGIWEGTDLESTWFYCEAHKGYSTHGVQNLDAVAAHAALAAAKQQLGEGK